MISKNEHTLLPELYNRLVRIVGNVPSTMLHVSIADQQMHLIENGLIVRTYAVSTSRYGMGNLEGSYKTPPGIHRIRDKIGGSAPSGRIFRDRMDTGEEWQEGITGENLILSRIMRLEGLEEGINRGTDQGKNIDSYERYIYIHGTNKESQIGTPLSHGCVCMKNDDIIELFDRIAEDTIVVID